MDDNGRQLELILPPVVSCPPHVIEPVRLPNGVTLTWQCKGCLGLFTEVEPIGTD
jgi:hypothetical protein